MWRLDARDEVAERKLTARRSAQTPLAVNVRLGSLAEAEARFRFFRSSPDTRHHSTFVPSGDTAPNWGLFSQRKRKGATRARRPDSSIVSHTRSGDVASKGDATGRG